jgi:hypothetical protein
MRCPKCSSELECVTKVGEPTKENGGVLFVAEELSTCTECADSVSQWKCPACGCRIYLGEDNTGEGVKA